LLSLKHLKSTLAKKSNNKAIEALKNLKTPAYNWTISNNGFNAAKMPSKVVSWITQLNIIIKNPRLIFPTLFTFAEKHHLNNHKRFRTTICSLVI